MRALLLILWFTLFAQVPAYAAPHISDFIYDDCPKAEALLGTLNETEKIEAARVCTDVLELESSAVVDPKSLAPQFPGSAPPRSTDLSDLLRATDPEREDRGKLCALSILRSLGSASSQSLSILIKQITSNKGSEEFKSELLRTAQVALLASDAKQRLEILPLIAKHFSTLPLTLLPGLAAEASPLIDLVVRSNDTILIEPRRLWWLPAPSRLIENQISAFFGSAEFCSAAFNLANAIVCPSKTLLNAIVAASTAQSPCRMQALRALRQISETVSPPASYCLGQTELLNAADLWREMIALALRFHNDGDPVSFLAITEALVPLAPGRSFTMLEKLAGTALNTPCPSCLGPHPGVELVSAVGRPAAPLIFKLLGGKADEAKQNARAALYSLARTDLKTVKPCLAFIANPEEAVRYACFQALHPFKQDLRTELTKIVKRSSLGATRDYASLLLLGVSALEPSALAVVKEQASQWQCAHIDAFAGLNLPQEIANLVDARLGSCLSSPAHQWASLLSFLESQPSPAPNPQVLLERALPQAREHKPSLVRILKLLPADRSQSELALLYEQLAQKQPLACESATLIWRILATSDLKRDFLKQYATILGTCTAGLLLPGAENELLAMFEKAAPIEQPSYIKLIGTLGIGSSDVIASLERYAQQGDAAAQFEATKALIRINAVARIPQAQLLSVLKGSRAHALLDSQINSNAVQQIRQSLGTQAPLDIFTQTTIDALERSAK
jgi:hypothetical protein